MKRYQCTICRKKSVVDSTGVTIPHGQGCRYFITVRGSAIERIPQ